MLASSLGAILAQLVNLWIIVLFVRIILSWFPISPSSPLATVFSVVYSLTEPVLGPVRRVIPSAGMFDLSPIVVIFAVRLIVYPIVASL